MPTAACNPFQICSVTELEPSLTSLLGEVLATANPGLTVIHAGHFYLTMHEGGVCDTFHYSNCKTPVRAQMAEFAKTTWSAACAGVIQSSQSHEIKLMTLVNDWQFLLPKEETLREFSRAAARLRAEYYGKYHTQPHHLLQALLDNDLSSDLILRQDDECWLFSEQLLRNRFNRTLRNMLKDTERAEQLGLRTVLTSHNQPIIYGSDEDGIEHCISRCGNSDCCGEVVQLLHDLQERGVKNFINLYPSGCLGPVRAGSMLAQRMFGLEEMAITNIAISPLESGTVQIVCDQV